MRKFKVTFFGLLGFLLIAFSVTVLINRFDEPLRPDIEKIVRQTYSPNDTEKRAYFFVLGLYAGETKNPEAVGEELWSKYVKLSDHEKGSMWAHEIHRQQGNPWQPTSTFIP